MRLRSVVSAVLLLAALGAGCGGDGAGKGDPWSGAGVEAPEVTERTEGGRTTVEVDAETSLPLPERRNRDGFGERVAKIAWRTHRGRIDVLEVSVRDGRGRSGERAWRREELESAFGPRLAGLDEGLAPPAAPARGDGPFSGREAADLDEGGAVLDELLSRTSREVLKADAAVRDGGRNECTEGLKGKPSGEFRRTSTLESSFEDDAHPIVVLQRIASYWAGQGLDVDTSAFFSGNEDGVTAVVDGVGRVSAGPRNPSDRQGRPGALTLQGTTDCLAP